MRECPKCKAQVSDTAKFCIKCGFNLKKYDEENSKHFCPECGTQFSGGYFCPECGHNIKDDLNLNEDSKNIEISFDDIDFEKPKKPTKDISFDDIDFEKPKSTKKKTEKVDINLDDIDFEKPKSTKKKIEKVDINLDDIDFEKPKSTKKKTEKVDINLDDIDFEKPKSTKKKTEKVDINLDDIDFEKPKSTKKKTEKVDINLDDIDFEKPKSTKKKSSINNSNEQDNLRMFEYEERKTGGLIIKKFIDPIETNVVIPSGVVVIEEGAFEKSLVISVSLPDGVKVISKRAFAECKYLKKLNIPASVNRIGEEAFADCSKLDINIPDTVSIKGKNMLVNTLAEKNALKKAEEERLAKIKEEEERKNKALNEHKSKCVDEVNSYAKEKMVFIKLPVENINDAVNTASATRAKNSIIKIIDEEYQKRLDEEALSKSKQKAIKELTALAKKKGVCYEPAYSKDIKSTNSEKELDKVISKITKKMDEIVFNRSNNKKDTKLEAAKVSANNEIVKYANFLGVDISSLRFARTIEQAHSLNDLSNRVAEIKKTILNKKSKK